MISALILGRKGSTGFPGKNTYPVLGQPLAWYPMTTAKQCSSIDSVYLSTDDPNLVAIAKDISVEIIDRPQHLATNTALGEDAFAHGYQEICRREGSIPEILVLLFCNSPTINVDTIERCISELRSRPEADSVVTVSRYNMWSPLRARKVTVSGFLDPFVPLETFGDPSTLNCDRDSQGDVLFADMGCSVIRSRNLDDLASGLLPQKWMGKKILPMIQEAGCDVDYEWQIPMVEWWLKRYSDII